jgi:alpha-1,2-mannosyltransferase
VSRIVSAESSRPDGPLRVPRFALVLFALSALTRIIWNYVVPNGANYIDLHVYIDGAATIGNGGLYDFVYRPAVPQIALEFTYPPFAALVFYPLHFLPFWVVGFFWQLGVIAALYGCAAVALKLMGCSDPRLAMAWTAIGIWFEPMRHVFELGQINVLLMLAVLWAVSSSRSWLSGLLVGWAAGIKLTPAIAGLYFVGARRWVAAGVSALTFAATVALSVLVLGPQGGYYFTNLLGDAHRVGNVATAANQSLRGVLGYALGYDPRYDPAVLAAIVVAALLTALAWRALDDDDRLGRIVIVALFGLLISPVSWTHHWIWLIPLVMWLVHGPLRARTAAVGWVWLAIGLVGPPWLLVFTDSKGWTQSNHWYLVWAGSIYVLGTLVTLAYLATLRRRAGRSQRPAPDRVG